jgi:hypothetical protein
VPDKRDIHQAKSKGRHKTAGQSGAQAGSRRGSAIVAGQDAPAAVIATDRPTNQGGAQTGGRRDKRDNGRS